MLPAPLLQRHRRLLSLVALSLLLHVIVLVNIGNRIFIVSPDALIPPATRIDIRLQAPPVRETAAAPLRPALAPAPPVKRIAAPTGTPRPDAPALAAATVTPPVLVAPTVPRPGTEGAAPPLRSVKRVRVHMPPSATLHYSFTVPDGTQRQTEITWQSIDNAYVLAVDGVTGALSSAGTLDDTGLAPRRSGMLQPDGSTVAVTFEPDRIALDGRGYPNTLGTQDPASVLLQLIGMGLADPEQLRGEVTFQVATPDGLVLMLFEVLEEEEALTTALGTDSTRHLRQVAPPGEARLEIWLAPARQWLPLQLRLVSGDGSTSTQTIRAIEAPAQAPSGQ